MWQEPGLSVAWEKIWEQAKQVEWCRLLGPKARNYTRGKSMFPKKTVENELEAFALKQISERAMKTRMAIMEESGWELQKYGKKMKCGNTWCWKFLIQNGLVSKILRKWCWMLRELWKRKRADLAVPAAPEKEVGEFPPQKTAVQKSSKRSAKVQKLARTMASLVQQSDYGLYKMRHRIHEDQIPFEIDQTARKTFVAAETSDLAIVTGIPGGDKRFGTLQVGMHGDLDLVQPRLGYLLACLRTLVIFLTLGLLKQTNKTGPSRPNSLFFNM